MTWSREELAEAFAGYQRTVEKCVEAGDWSTYADMFTEDARYVEHAYGTFTGRDEIRAWVTRTMSSFPGRVMTSFPANWSVFDTDRGWAICEIDNPMADPGDGSSHAAANVTILEYAGDGLWSREEDVYNPLEFLRMASGWCRAAEAAGTLPDDARAWLEKVRR